MLLRGPHWSFQPEEKRTPDQNERWWQDCYLTGHLESVLENTSGWTVIMNRGGEGASTILRGFRRRIEPQSLCLDYHPQDWREQMFENEGAHLINLLRLGSQALRTYIKTHPDKLSLLSLSQREFLRWVIQRFNDLRAYPRWLDSLPLEVSAMMDGIEYDPEFYPSQTDPEQASGQIEELGNLVQRIGLSQVVYFLDASKFLTPFEENTLAGLYQSLPLMEHPNVRVVASLPENLVNEHNLILDTRDRVNYFPIPEKPGQVTQVVSRYLECATQGRVKKVEDILSPEGVAQLKTRIDSTFLGTRMAGWVGVADILSRFSLEQPGYLKDGSLEVIWEAFYREHIRLRVDPSKKQVWRGYTLIHLDEAPFDFLLRLWQAKGYPLDEFGPGISSDYKYTLTKRVRDAIEPIEGVQIYLQNARNRGYWLENTTFR